jgi:hypothetical protein
MSHNNFQKSSFNWEWIRTLKEKPYSSLEMLSWTKIYMKEKCSKMSIFLYNKYICIYSIYMYIFHIYTHIYICSTYIYVYIFHMYIYIYTYICIHTPPTYINGNIHLKDEIIDPISTTQDEFGDFFHYFNSF